MLSTAKVCQCATNVLLRQPWRGWTQSRWPLPRQRGSLQAAMLRRTSFGAMSSFGIAWLPKRLLSRCCSLRTTRQDATVTLCDKHPSCSGRQISCLAVTFDRLTCRRLFGIPVLYIMEVHIVCCFMFLLLGRSPVSKMQTC